VAKIIQRSPIKQCQADPVLTWLVKRASVIAAICNSSFQQVTFPQRCKKAIVRPLLKKSTMNPQDSSSCRSISNLSFLSKVIEKVVDSTLSEHIDDYHLLPIIQSAYRPYHSTETAIVSIHNDMIEIVDQCHISALTLLDMSDAFHTLDHSILLEVLRKRLEPMAMFLDEWQSFSMIWRHNVAVRSTSRFCTRSAITKYAEDVSLIFDRHNLHHHLFAELLRWPTT